MSITIDVVFRHDVFGDVQMFYYDEHKTLVCFSMEEGHGEACYSYYLATKHCNKPSKEIEERIKRIINYYEDGDTKLRVMKRLKHGVCSYA